MQIMHSTFFQLFFCNSEIIVFTTNILIINIIHKLILKVFNKFTNAPASTKKQLLKLIHFPATSLDNIIHLLLLVKISMQE